MFWGSSHSSPFPMSLNSSRLQSCLCSDISYLLFWPSLCTSFSCTKYWIRRRVLCSCSNSKEGNESGKRMTNYWVSVVAEVHAKQTCASCLLCVQGIPDHSPPGKLHASKNKIWLFVPGNTFFFFPQVTLGFFQIWENNSMKIKRIHVLLPLAPTGIKLYLSSFSILEGEFHQGLKKKKSPSVLQSNCMHLSRLQELPTPSAVNLH